MITDDAWRPRLAARARLKFDPIAKQELILFPEAALALNETGAAIVRFATAWLVSTGACGALVAGDGEMT